MTWSFCRKRARTDDSQAPESPKKQKVDDKKEEEDLVHKIISCVHLLMEPESVEEVSKLCTETLLIPVEERKKEHYESVPIIAQAIESMKRRVSTGIEDVGEQIASLNEQSEALGVQHTESKRVSEEAKDNLKKLQEGLGPLKRRVTEETSAAEAAAKGKAEVKAFYEETEAKRKALTKIYEEDFPRLKAQDRGDNDEKIALWEKSVAQVSTFCHAETEDEPLKNALERAFQTNQGERTAFDDFTIDTVEGILKSLMLKLQHRVSDRSDKTREAEKTYVDAQTVCADTKKEYDDMVHRIQAQIGAVEEMMKEKDRVSRLQITLTEEVSQLENDLSEKKNHQDRLVEAEAAFAKLRGPEKAPEIVEQTPTSRRGFFSFFSPKV